MRRICIIIDIERVKELTSLKLAIPGTMFALVASLEVLEMLIASVIFNSIYSATVDWMPGFCYFLMSGIIVLPIILMM